MSRLAFASSREFAEHIAQPNVDYFTQNTADLRAAYNSVMAVDSIVGFLYREAIAKGFSSAKSDDVFRASLAQEDESYSLVRDLAKTFKHVELTRPASLTSIDQTAVAGRPYGSGLYGVGSYGGNEVMIVDDDGNVHHCISRVLKAWDFLRTKVDDL